MIQQQRLIVDSMGKKAEMIVQPIKVVEMNAKNKISKWLAMLLLVIASTMGAMAQTSTTLTQDVCPGTEPYFIHPSNTLSTFIWTITPGTSGTEWTISTPTDTITNIIWTNPAIPSDFTVIFREIAPTGCDDWKSIIVTVNPLPAPVIAGSGTVCQNQTGVLYSTIGVTGNTYTWLVSGGIVTAGAGTNEITVAWDTAGNGTVEVTETVTATTCETIVNIPVLVNPAPVLTINDPLAVCSPGTIDLQAAAIILGSTLPTGTVLTYWTDALATTALATPAAVAASGTYYIKAATAEGCSVIEPVDVIVNPLPVLTINDPLAVCSPGTIDLQAAAITLGSTLPTGNVLTYWTDALATTALVTPAAVAASGTYYIKAATAEGCSVIEPVIVIVNPTPTTSSIFHN